MNKSVNLEKVYKQFFSKEEDSSHVKCRYSIIGRLISINILFKLSYANILINCEL